MGEWAGRPEETFTLECVCDIKHEISFLELCREGREHRVFDALLQMVPGLEQRLVQSSDDDDVVRIAELVSF
jgi:hypothetical protein